MSVTRSAASPLLDRARSVTQLIPGFNDQRYLFLLSHMRSYSSLLAHILGSSPEIDGYGETQIKYRSRLDLWKLRREIRRSTERSLQGRWLLDKLLHNYIQSPDRLIKPGKVRALIFLRRAEPTIRSIVTLANIQNPLAPLANPHRACDYYVSRLHRLREDGQRLGEQAFYFDAESITEQPDLLLAELNHWLNLKAPLHTVYATARRTGENGFGDPLQNIHAGRILDPSTSTIAPDLDIPGSALREADEAWRRCRGALLSDCSWTSKGLYWQLLPQDECAGDPGLTRLRA